MTEPSEAAAVEIFPSVSNERRLECQADLTARRKIAERIIQRLLDEKDAEIDRLKSELGEKTEQIEMMVVAGDEYKIKTTELIGRLKQQITEAEEYLVELRVAWSWREGDRWYRNERYEELNSFIKQLAEATNQSEGGDAH